jgi:hypothetical protein
MKPKPFVDLVGYRVGIMTVIELVNRTTCITSSTWKVRCDCGTVITKTGNKITCGTARSCGCVYRKSLGKSMSPEYRSYAGAKGRCNNPRHDDYENYGARGIEFKFKSFPHFMSCVGPRPEGMTIDRIDNNGNYEPGNVRWATPFQQSMNTRSTMSEQEIREALAWLSDGFTPDELAAKYDIHVRTVYRIKTRLSQGKYANIVPSDRELCTRHFNGEKRG